MRRPNPISTKSIAWLGLPAAALLLSACPDREVNDTTRPEEGVYEPAPMPPAEPEPTQPEPMEEWPPPTERQPPEMEEWPEPPEEPEREGVGEGEGQGWPGGPE